MRGRHGDDDQVHGPLGQLVRAGAAGGGRTGLGGVVVRQVHLDAAAGQGEGDGRADQSGSDDKGGFHGPSLVSPPPGTGGALVG
ncbi:hypothetical protein GCM10010507_14230 [Streptomyces cinnamoneus]|uniref:Uncharacterized protein n=1 Tax=Streptomyces cinnamoneus TaxID=53446 RepID=A0A918TCG6_STRCJ|nr:hypothetical protein GCM10010507_14230 [Streptomyces cinnamoneus]